jgi:ribose 5-phosphate isomerase A
MTVTAAGFKRRAGEQAASLVQSGMVVGLGAGSTATVAICRIPSGSALPN